MKAKAEIARAIANERDTTYHGEFGLQLELSALRLATVALSALDAAGYAVVPKEIDGKMWSEGRSMLSGEARAFRDATTYEVAERRLDTGPAEIWKTMLAASQGEAEK